MPFGRDVFRLLFQTMFDLKCRRRLEYIKCIPASVVKEKRKFDEFWYLSKRRMVYTVTSSNFLTISAFIIAVIILFQMIHEPEVLEVVDNTFDTV